MNPSLIPGYPITADLSLTEELPAPPGATFRVWFAFDVRIGKIVVIKIHGDGRVEPVSSSPSAMTMPTGATTPEPAKPVAAPVTPAPFLSAPPPAPEPVIPPVQKNVYTKPLYHLSHSRSYPNGVPDLQMPPVFPSRQRRTWLRYAIWLLVVLAGGYALYFYRKPLRKYSKKTYALILTNIKPSPALPMDSTTAQKNNTTIEKDAVLTSEPIWKGNGATSDSTNVLMESIQQPDEIDMNHFPSPPVDPNESLTAPPKPEPVANTISLQDATRLLSRLRTIPAYKHSAIFRDVKLCFETYRTNGGDPLTIDRLYVEYMGRAAQSVTTYRQNGDSASKQYALNWYQTAYALKPAPDLAERMERLRNDTPPKQSPARKPAQQRRNARSTGRVNFEPDPEVN